jgi:iron(III) transport system substrate-binding protein
LLKAKQAAEGKGYVFYTNRDEIVNKARKEGNFHGLIGVAGSLKPLAEAFRKKYPFIHVEVQTLTTVDEGQRALLNIKAGQTKWDVARTTPTLYSDWLPHVWKVDLLGMAEQRVLEIPPQMIDPANRSVIALGSRVVAVVYNKELVSSSQLPKSWEDMLKPEWKGKKFATDMNPAEIAGLVPAWGLEKTLDFARKIAAQQPIWSRGSTRTVTAVAAGEVPLLLHGASHSLAVSAQRKDPRGVLQWFLLEPVPVRFRIEQAILSAAGNPHAALLWLEFMASPQGQKLMDEHEPLVASLFSKGASAEQAIRGKKLSLVSWEDNVQIEKWVEKLTEAYGFPTAGTK